MADDRDSRRLSDRLGQGGAGQQVLRPGPFAEMGIVDDAGTTSLASCFNLPQQGQSVANLGGTGPVGVEDQPQVGGCGVELRAVPAEDPRTVPVTAQIEDGPPLCGEDPRHLRRESGQIGHAAGGGRGDQFDSGLFEQYLPFPGAEVGVDDIEIDEGNRLLPGQGKGEVDCEFSLSAAAVAGDDDELSERIQR